MSIWSRIGSLFSRRSEVEEEKSLGFTVPTYQSGLAQLPNTNYQTYAKEGYMRNPLVFASIQELATSAAEPIMMAKKGGKWVHEGPIIDLLERPNPFMTRFEFWATIIMHRALAGNAYAVKERSMSGRVVELWILRPDRMRVVPSATKHISHYEYHVGDGSIFKIAADDVIHFKERHPLDDWYGMPRLMPISGITDIANFMENFVKSAFEHGGMPGAVLTIKQKVTQEDKDQIRERFRRNFTGSNGWHELLVLDNAEASYTPMTQSLGTRGLVIPELHEILEAEIPMVFGVPQSLIGTRTSYQNGGYANKRAEATDFWVGTLTPLYKELAGPLTLRLVPDFFGITEVAFDLTDVFALQEDFDKLATRWIALYAGGIASFQESRKAVGLNPEPKAGDLFAVGAQTEVMPADELGEPPEPLALPAPANPVAEEPVAAAPSRNGSRGT